MSWINTGYQRATKLIIKTYDNGVLTATDEFPFKEAFTYNGTTYPAVTDDTIQKMTDANYNARAQAYAAYVQLNYQSQYPGLEVTSAGARVYNDVACPLP